MHLRALALQAFDLTPVARPRRQFEVEDAKGNKVFKRDAEDVGLWHRRRSISSWPTRSTWATTTSGPSSATQQAEKTVAVKHYVLPKFKTEREGRQDVLPAEGDDPGRPAERLLLRQAGRQRPR